MSVTVFFSSVSGNTVIKKKQEKIFLILDSKKINYKPVDVAGNSDDKDLMRRIVGNPKALPPQIANGDVYCGDFEAFENAIEVETLESFLKL